MLWKVSLRLALGRSDRFGPIRKVQGAKREPSLVKNNPVFSCCDQDKGSTSKRRKEPLTLSCPCLLQGIRTLPNGFRYRGRFSNHNFWDTVPSSTRPVTGNGTVHTVIKYLTVTRTGCQGVFY